MQRPDADRAVLEAELRLSKQRLGEIAFVPAHLQKVGEPFALRCEMEGDAATVVGVRPAFEQSPRFDHVDPLGDPG